MYSECIKALEIVVGDAKCGVLTSESMNDPGVDGISWQYGTLA